MKTLKIAFLGMATLLMASCYKDLGNYEYDDSINDIKVKLEPIYGLRKTNTLMPYTIVPEIDFAGADSTDLEYVWLANKKDPNARRLDTIGVTRILNDTIDPNSRNFNYKYTLRLYVKDKRYNTVTMRAATLEIIKPYSFSWCVLQEKDGHAEIGAVEYVGSEMMVTPDAYTKEQGESLKGKPLSLAVSQTPIDRYSRWPLHTASVLLVNTTEAEESGLFDQDEGFKKTANWGQLFPPQEVQNLDFSTLRCHATNQNFFAYSCNDRVFNTCQGSPFIYEMVKNPELVGDYDIEQIVVGPHAAIGYDKKNHRFLHLDLQASEYWTGQGADMKGAVVQQIIPNEDNAIDPNKVDPSIDIFGSCNGYQYSKTGRATWQKYTGYMFGAGADNTMHVYVFRYYAATHGTEEPTIADHFQFVMPEGVTKNTVFTSSPMYNNILFYGYGNKVYKLDASTGKSVMIYQHEESTAEVVDVQMAVEQAANFYKGDDDGTESYGHPYERTLGVAVNKKDGTAELVVLHLNTIGKVSDEPSKYPAIQVHKGFSTIKDINFI